MNSHDAMLILVSVFSTAIFAAGIGIVVGRIVLRRCKRVYQTAEDRQKTDIRDESLTVAALQEREKFKTDALERTQKAVLNILEDIQEDRNALARLTERFTLATRSGNIGVLEFDVAAQTIQMDGIAAGLYGLPAQETTLSFADWQTYVHPDDLERVMAAIQQTLKTGNNFEEEFRIVIRGVGPRYLKGSAQGEKDVSGRVMRMTGVNIDISAEKAAERLKNEFISLASHQLRTPLTGMKWATELLLKQRETMTKEQTTYLDRILQSETRMVNLVNGMLNISRLDSGVLEITPEPVGIQQLLQDAISDFGLVAEQTGVTVRTDFSDEDVIIPLDRGVFGTIVENLLSNAMKYTPRGGSVTLGVRTDDREIFVDITDTGFGIPASAQGRIFEKFFRADNAKASPAEGTGLGLYTAKSMAQQAGGDLSFVSEEGKGTTFTLRLPKTGMKKRSGTKRIEQVNLHVIS